MTFPDHFSARAESYARFRPHYPDALFRYLASLTENQDLAWDCATGNGQAAEALARFFRLVAATDASRKQIQNAFRNNSVRYCVGLAERAPLQSGIADLVTVAQALHWLQPVPFFAEVCRVLKPRGVVAVWCYNLLQIDPATDAILLHFYTNVVGPYWSPERKLLEEGYRTIVFPFEEMSIPEFHMEAEWSFADLTGYLATWSSSQTYVRMNGSDPVLVIRKELLDAWGDPNKSRTVRWPLSLRMGRLK